MKASDIIIIESLFARFKSLQFEKKSGDKKMGLPILLEKSEREAFYAKWSDGYSLLVAISRMVNRSTKSLSFFDFSSEQDKRRWEEQPEIMEQLKPIKSLIPALKKNVKHYESKYTKYIKVWSKAVIEILPAELVKYQDDLLKNLKRKMKKECLGKPVWSLKIQDYGAFDFTCKFKFVDSTAEFTGRYSWFDAKKIWDMKIIIDQH